MVHKTTAEIAGHKAVICFKRLTLGRDLARRLPAPAHGVTTILAGAPSMGRNMDAPVRLPQPHDTGGKDASSP
jgi:hypothetical protein